jgi:type I restriction enzyme S subunit
MLNALAALDLDKLGKGVKPGLGRSEAYDQIIAVPPLAEQRRIVAKVDELMGLCDRLTAARAAREAVRDRLMAASLARLNAPDPKAFQSDAGFALDALPALTTRPDQIKALRQSILNLAVRGQLVPQDAKDEPASELLKRIAREKARLVKEGKAKRQDLLPEIDLDQVPFAPNCSGGCGSMTRLWNGCAMRCTRATLTSAASTRTRSSAIRLNTSG